MISDEVAVVDTQQTTTFTSDIPVFQNNIGPIADIPYPLKAGPEENRFHDLKDFLSRPVVCAGCTVNWDGTSVQNTDLITMNVPSAMLSINMINEKLSGFFGFRATCVVRVQVNAQRFQQGILLLNTIPIPTLLGTDRTSQIDKHIAFKSQLPSVRMNIASNSEIQLKIPFVSPQNFYQRREYSYDWAQFNVTVYSPLVGGNAQITCWCHFEDIEPVFPIAQSGKISSGVKGKKYDNSDLEDSGGILSGATRHFASAFGDLSKVPLLSSIAAPTAWFFAASSKALSAFGFSKPVSTKPRTAMNPRLMSHSNNCDSEDNSDSHGLFLSNKVARLPGFAGTDIDEMSMQYITSIPSYLANFSWTTANVVNAQLYTQLIRPRSMSQTYTTTLNAVAYTHYVFAPFCYLAMLFQYWRGTIKFRFLVAKTEYHSGRLMLVYNPDGTNALTEANSNYCYRWIWDLRESNEFEVDIPFVSGTPWRTNTLGDGTGFITAFVLNPLIAPSSVSSSINILVEVAGGEDFQLAGFSGDLGLYPVLAYGPELQDNEYLGHTEKSVYIKSNVYKEDHSLIEAQAPGTQVLQRGNVGRTAGMQDSINPSGSPDDQGTSSLYTIGEMVTSLRQLLKRCTIMLSTGYTAAGRDKVLRFDPTAVCLPTFNTSVSPPTLPTAGSQFVDYYDWIVPLFAMRRGGVLTKIYNAASNSDSAVTSFLNYTGTTSQAPLSDSSGTRNNISMANNMIVSSSTVQGALEVLVPYYSASHSTPVQTPALAFTTNSTDAFQFTNNPQQTVIGTTSNSTNFIVLNVMRQVADDFDLGFFLCTVPLHFYGTGASTYPI